MRLLMFFGMAVSLGVSPSDAQAEQTVTFEGQVYPLSILTENCNSKADDPQAMIACFNNLSELIEQQSSTPEQAEAATPSETQSSETADAEQQEADRLAAERREAERLAAEKLEAERLEAERQEIERQKAELAAERLEAERQKAEQLKAEQLEAERQRNLVAVPQALEDLRTVAQYQDAETGLSITGTDCNIRIVYFGNYYHLSRRNVSTLDLFSAEFDASKLQYDKLSDVTGGQVPVLRGVMADGATAVTSGGVGMDSALHNFDPKSARSTLDDYASQVVSQLPPNENQTFDFVLVHPARGQVANDIRGAFETFARACKG